ncbi:hypothetical protein [Candidatus Leptofilum sp.]|uniref:hypothetical protein n=1 Tax=Candidatus Leptofilum sp. TaxID=3241576 RepID=UPI003B5921B4
MNLQVFDENIFFESDHLLSKWGFADGTLLDNLLRQNGYGHMAESNDEWYEFSRRVLCEVVEMFVCTKIHNGIKPYRMATSHNPIRVYEVDGRHVTDYADPPILQPLTVSVPKEVILETAVHLYAARFTPSGEIVSHMVRSEWATAVATQHGWDE